jgi:hypothetical protein
MPRRHAPRLHGALPALAGIALLAGCTDIAPMEAEPVTPAHSVAAAAAPSPLVTVAAAGVERSIWPFTGTDVGDDAHASDPINLVFIGHADPRSIRAALLELDGNRPAFPPLPFFQCTWDDAMGGNQSAYADGDGWAGSAIQLECGTYQGLRFHLRLFRVGEWTVGNAHFETIIPGTHDHQVLSWKLAEQLVTADIARAGLLAAPPATTAEIHPAPWFRTIHPLLYWSPQLQPLHPLINAVVVDAETVGIPTDGHATVLTLGRTVKAVPGTRRQELVIAFDQVIPKPLCAGPSDFVHVRGPLRLRQDVTVAASGVLSRQFHVDAELVVTPVNPMTGQPLAASSPARINGLYRGMAADGVHSASALLNQRLLPAGAPAQQLLTDLQVGPHGVARYRRQERCGRE